MKGVRDRFDFLHKDKHQSFLQPDTIVCVVIARHAQNTQNKKFAVSLQYLKEEVKDEVDFVHADQHQTFLHVYQFYWAWSVMPKIFKIASLQNLKKEVRDEVDFLYR